MGTKPILRTSFIAAAWAITVAAGLRAMLIYDNAPGQIGAVPIVWPASRIELAKDRATLVMLAHPRCPCTRASISELAKIMARVDGKAVGYVLFVRPNGSGSDWKDTDLRRSAAAIPGVTVLSDIDGVEAQRFGAETSGHTLLFDRQGRLLFSGGITQSRGHAGDNEGEDAIVSLINNRPGSRDHTSVFGCALANRDKIQPSDHCSH